MALSDAQRRVSTEFVCIDETPVAVRVVEPEGPARGDVVLCHGTPWSARVWETVARSLSIDYRVFMWDMPGYGRSTQGRDVAVDLRTQMARLNKLVSYWDLDFPHIVAHDIGGAVALGAHLLEDTTYADLFLWDVVTLDPWGSPFFRLVADNSDVFAQLPLDLHAALVRQYIAGASGRPLSAAELDLLTEPWCGATGSAAFYRQIASLSPLHTHPVVERLGAIRCPVRIGWGGRDPWIPVEQAFELQGLIPNAPEVVVLPDAGHLVPVEAPASMGQAIRAWLER